MNIPEIKPYEEQAVDMLVSVINRAKETLGVRQTLKQLAKSRDIMTAQAKVPLTTLECPLVITSEQLLRQTIEKKWRLTDVFMYVIKYINSSNDECSRYYYFEAIFSQPTAAYPIPQATASVFFRVEDKHTEPPEIRGVPLAIFSQPTAAYPIPQATASVFFRVEDKHTEPPEIRGVPLMTFRIEGHRTDHDVRFVTLIPDWILAVIQMKIKLFRRIEELRLF